MNNKHNKYPDGQETIIFTRYKQMLYGSCLAAILGLVNFLLIHDFSLEEASLFRFTFYSGLLIVCGFSIFNAERKVYFSMAFFVWGLALLTTFLLLGDGGLRGSANIMYPAIMMVAALLLRFRDALLLFVFSSIVIFLLGMSEVLDLKLFTEKEYTYEDVNNIILLISASGLVAWLIGGDYRYVLKRLRDENYRNKESQKEIQYLAHHDSLTGLSSLRECKRRYEEMLLVCEGKIYFVFIDLDDFKFINDNYSHYAGDKLLTEVANRVKSVINDYDIACRLGGDEFLLILSRNKDFLINELVESLVNSVAKPFDYEGTVIDVKASVGIAVSPDNGLDFDDVRKKADNAMYKAKQHGKNRYDFYDENLYKEISRKNYIVNSVKKAIRENSLSLYFQGIYSLQDERIVGAEALVRWTKNNPHNISPGEFIPIIEATTQIVELGEWVIWEACRICKKWHDKGETDLYISVNISSTQLSRSELAGLVNDALQYYQLPPSCLELELTEHLLVNRSCHVMEQLEAIRKLGVSISIDDFGTGYSNLGYLTRFRVNKIKLDKSFVGRLHETAKDLAIVRAIINMGNILGMQVVAEGIESRCDLQVLDSAGCDLGQGYYWEKPCHEEDFLEKLICQSKSSGVGYLA